MKLADLLATEATWDLVAPSEVHEVLEGLVTDLQFGTFHPDNPAWKRPQIQMPPPEESHVFIGGESFDMEPTCVLLVWRGWYWVIQLAWGEQPSAWVDFSGALDG